MLKKKFVYVLDYLKKFKAVHKNKPQQNKKVVLTTTAYFKVSTPVWQQVLRLPSFAKKGVSSIKQKKHSAERCISTPPPPLFFFHAPFLISSLSLETWTHPRNNSRFYDNTPESGRLKTINIKPWKPITYRNCMS